MQQIYIESFLKDYAAEKTRESSKTGEEAHVVFREWVKRIALANKVNPDNIAINT